MSDQAELDEILSALAGKVLCPQCGREVDWADRKVPVTGEPGVIQDAILWAKPCGCHLTLPQLVAVRKAIWREERLGHRSKDRRRNWP